MLQNPIYIYTDLVRTCRYSICWNSCLQTCLCSIFLGGWIMVYILSAGSLLYIYMWPQWTMNYMQVAADAAVCPWKKIHTYIYIYEFENRMSVGTNTSIFVKGWTSNRRNGHARCLTLPTPIRQGERWPGSESLNSPLGYLFIGYLGISDPPKICVFWQMIPRPRPCLVFVHFFWTIRCL